MQSLPPISRLCENITHDVGSTAGLRCWLNMRTDFGKQIIVIVYVFDWVQIEYGECDKRHKLVRASRPVQIRSLPGAVPD